MKSSFFLFALLMLLLPLAGRENQHKVLLPPEIGYKNLRTALSFARAFYKKGEFQKGFELFRKCSGVKGLSDLYKAECLWYAGLCAEKAGDLEKAKLYYGKTLLCKGGKFTSNARKSLAALGQNKNLFINGSFEKDIPSPWNRMIDQEYLPENSWQRDNTTALQGKYSLRSKGNAPLVLMTEGFCTPGIFSCAMKSAQKGGKVKVEIFSYARFVPQLLAKKEFALTPQWQRYKVALPKKYLKFETGTAPLFCRITPAGKEPVWIDCVQLEEGSLTAYKEYTPPLYNLEKAKEFFPKHTLRNFASRKVPVPGDHLPGVWEIGVTYPVTASGVPVDAALPLPQGKWFGNTLLTVKDKTGKQLPLEQRILARWPQDGSVRSVLLSFDADLTKGKNSFFVQEGKAPQLNTQASAPLDFFLTAEDAAGKKYVSKNLSTEVEYKGKLNSCFLIRGVLVNGGTCFAPFEVRQKVHALTKTVEISALVRNPFSKMMVIKNAALHLDSGRNGKKALYRQYFNKSKNSFTHVPDGRCGFVQSAGGTLVMREASLRHPVKLEVSEKGRFTAHLWPDDLRPVILSRKTVLHREFLYTPRHGAAIIPALGYRAVAMAKSEYFAKSRFFIFPTGSWTENQPHFKKSMGDYGFFFSGEAKRIFNYPGRTLHGLFNYGDVYGDGGWGNLESYLDFSEMIYAISMNDPLPLKWALNRARHYRDMDIAGGVCCYHSANHSGGVGFDFSHSWPQGVLYHYLLTGDLRSLDVIHEVIANYMSRPVNDKFIQGSRSLGRFLLGLADFYALTGDPAIKKRFLEQLKYTEKHELKPGEKDQTLFRWHGRLDPFHVWYGCTAMMQMYLLTGDKNILPSFHREIQNSLNPDFYRNDLNELYPGAPFKETLPLHAGFLSCHRGALFYVLMKFYSELTGENKYLRLAQLSAYAAFLPGIPKAWPMDAMRLAVLGNTSEKELLKEVFALQKKAAARSVLNGDFSKTPDWFTHWHLPAGRQMSYDDAVKSWPLREKKEFSKLINEYRQREALVSPWRGYSRNFAWMDHKEFGEKAPALRVTLSSKWAMGKSTTLACAPIYAEAGTWRFSGLFKFEEGISKATDIFVHAIPQGEKRSRIMIPLHIPGENTPASYHTQNFLANMKSSVKMWKKPGWKHFEFVFTAKKNCIYTLQFNFKLNNKSTQAHAYVDDIKFERVKK